jgi:hypothetical protein
MGFQIDKKTKTSEPICLKALSFSFYSSFLFLLHLYLTSTFFFLSKKEKLFNSSFLILSSQVDIPTGTGTLRCTLRETCTNSQRTNQQIRHSDKMDV